MEHEHAIAQPAKLSMVNLMQHEINSDQEMKLNSSINSQRETYSLAQSIRPRSSPKQ